MPETAKSDMNMGVKSEEKHIKREEKEEKLTNILFSTLIFLTAIGTSVMLYQLPEFTKDLIERNTSYNFPKVADMWITIPLMGCLIVLKIVLERLFRPISEAIISKKYTNPADETNFLLGKIYVKKLSTNMFKLIFYTYMVILGYKILSPLYYFPTSLGGTGQIMDLFSKGYPDTFYHVKPEYFDFYYLTGLAYCFTDLIWLVGIYELQSDFVMMLLHHACTISLISFSFLTNWSNIGCVILFLHDVGDIFVYIARIVVNTDLKPWVGILSGIVLIIVYIYTRIYVFSDAIYCLTFKADWFFQWPTFSLDAFLCFLFIMHVNWVYLILKKICRGLIENKIEDTANVKISKTH